MDEHVLQSVLVVVVGGPKHIPPRNTYSSVPTKAPGMMRGELELDLHAWTPLAEPQGPTKKFFLNLTGESLERFAISAIPQWTFILWALVETSLSTRQSQLH